MIAHTAHAYNAATGVALLRPYEEKPEAPYENVSAMKKAGAGRARRKSIKKRHHRFSRGAQSYLPWIEINSTSKISVELGPMSAPAPRTP